MDLAKLVGKSEGFETAQGLGISVKCYTEIGILSAWGKISVDAREIINIDAQHSTEAIFVQVETGGDYPQTGNAIIKYENLPKIYTAIEKLKTINPQSTKFSQIEAEITIDDLRVVVFNTQKSKMMCSIGAEGSSIHLDLYRLDEFIKLLKKAQSTIDACKSGNS